MKSPQNQKLTGTIIAAVLAVIVAIGVVVVIAVSSGSSFHYPYKTLPKPHLPAGETVPSTCTKHVMGGCLPQPAHKKFPTSESIVSSNQGPDLSNNDPVWGDGAWAAIGARNSFAIFKVTEGTGFVDSTAAPMAALAKRHGLVVGGYDFLHVCGDDAGTEARVFVSHLIADGLTGPNTLPGTADAEFGGGCNVQAWIGTWAATVHSLTSRIPMVYTGEWWWGPHAGCYWPAGSTAWISGYTSSINSVPRVCGHGGIDWWQYTDSGWNGASSSDMSAWQDGASAFNAISNSGPPPDPYAIFPMTVYNLGNNISASEYKIAKGWDDRHCLHPTIRNVCGFLNFRLKLLVGRLKAVTKNWQHSELMKFHRLKRVEYMQHEIAQTKPPWGQGL